MLPVHDVIPTRTVPWVVLALIGTSAAAFVIELTVSAGTLPEIIYGYGLIPSAVTWFTPLTSLFLHHGWLHVGADAYALWLFGASVEDRLGHGRFLVFALAAGVAGALGEVSVRAASPLPVIGSASLVAGVIAAHFLLFRQSKTLVLVPSRAAMGAAEVPTLLFVAFWLLLQALGSSGQVTSALLTGGPTIFAPLGGALAGVLLFFPLRSRDRERVEWWGS